MNPHCSSLFTNYAHAPPCSVPPWRKNIDHCSDEFKSDRVTCFSQWNADKHNVYRLHAKAFRFGKWFSMFLFPLLQWPSVPERGCWLGRQRVEQQPVWKGCGMGEKSTCRSLNFGGGRGVTCSYSTIEPILTNIFTSTNFQGRRDGVRNAK